MKKRYRKAAIMPASTYMKISKIAKRLLCALNNWITLAVVMTAAAIFPVFRYIELMRRSYRLRTEDSIIADSIQAEAWAWGFGAIISINAALVLWGMVRSQMRRRSTLASMATACDCDTDDQDPHNHEKGCRYREFLCWQAYEMINQM